MHYLVLLGGDESLDPDPGTPEFDEMMAGYQRFGELAGPNIRGAEALQPTATAATIRHGDGAPLVTDGPYAETTEAIGGFYVLEVDTLDDAIELAKEIPAATTGWIALRPMVMWQSADDPEVTGERYLAAIYGKESPGDTPETPEWEAGAAEHGKFVEDAGAAVLSGGAVHPLDTTTSVRVRDGEVLLSDGPINEAAELVGGFYLVQAASRDDAVALAHRIPVGEGGAVELRPIWELG
jgi:hypothetical protein